MCTSSTYPSIISTDSQPPSVLNHLLGCSIHFHRHLNNFLCNEVESSGGLFEEVLPWRCLGLTKNYTDDTKWPQLWAWFLYSPGQVNYQYPAKGWVFWTLRGCLVAPQFPSLWYCLEGPGMHICMFWLRLQHCLDLESDGTKSNTLYTFMANLRKQSAFRIPSEMELETRRVFIARQGGCYVFSFPKIYFGQNWTHSFLLPLKYIQGSKESKRSSIFFFLFCGSQQFFPVSLCAKITWIPQLPRLSRCQLKKSLVLITAIGGQLFLDAVTVTVTDQPNHKVRSMFFSLTNMVKWKFQLVMNVMYPH